jgi:hypothetical protein
MIQIKQLTAKRPQLDSPTSVFAAEQLISDHTAIGERDSHENLIKNYSVEALPSLHHKHSLSLFTHPSQSRFHAEKYQDQEWKT